MPSRPSQSSFPAPPVRRVRGFAFDPSLSVRLETARVNEVVFTLPWEQRLEPGPVGEYVRKGSGEYSCIIGGAAGTRAVMPRQVHIEYAGATYHAMCRGDRRESIFVDEADRETFLTTLAEAAGRCGWLVHGYVLMSNHYHLLIETPEPNLVRGMTWLQTTYTVRYNTRHRTCGHLFGGRYKAIVVDPEEPRYLAVLLDYVHLNPVRAGLARPRGPGLLDYRWSSLRGYLFKRERAPWLTVSRGLSALDRNDTVVSRRAMLADLERRMREEAAERCGLAEVPGHESLQSTLRRGWYFGREAFREWLLGKSAPLLERHRRSKQNYHGPEVKDHGKAQAKEIIKQALKKAGLDAVGLKTLSKSDPRKAAAARAVRKQCAVPLAWLAEELKMGSAMNVSRLTRAQR